MRNTDQNQLGEWKDFLLAYVSLAQPITEVSQDKNSNKAESWKQVCLFTVLDYNCLTNGINVTTKIQLKLMPKSGNLLKDTFRSYNVPQSPLKTLWERVSKCLPYAAYSLKVPLAPVSLLLTSSKKKTWNNFPGPCGPCS